MFFEAEVVLAGETSNVVFKRSPFRVIGIAPLLNERAPALIERLPFLLFAGIYVVRVGSWPGALPTGSEHQQQENTGDSPRISQTGADLWDDRAISHVAHLRRRG